MLKTLVFALASAIAALAPTAPAFAADPPAMPDDLDALQLADKAPAAAPQQAQRWRVFAEGAAGRAS